MESKRYLKPCPFCGSKACMTVHDNNYVIECSQCQDVSTYDERSYPMSAEQAIAIWNRRAERTCRIVDFNVSGPHAEDSVWELSCGHKEIGDKPLYCPVCGSKVVDE